MAKPPRSNKLTWTQDKNNMEKSKTIYNLQGNRNQVLAYRSSWLKKKKHTNSALLSVQAFYTEEYSLVEISINLTVY